MTEEQQAEIIERVWTVRQSYQIREHPLQAKMWRELLDLLENLPADERS